MYYKPIIVTDLETIDLLEHIDKIYTSYPFYGSRRMQAHLRNLGYCVSRKRIQRLYKLLGLEAIYPKTNQSKANAKGKKYPYLLDNVLIKYRDHVWSSNITFIRLKQRFVYLMAIIDWFSRYVLDWQLSTCLEADFCIEALSRALSRGSCEIFNTDQGCQFTSYGFTQLLLDKNIKISMDGKGRALDNIFVERLWRSVKYEAVYLNQWETVQEARHGLRQYFDFYNHQRLHQSLGYRTPWTVYQGQTGGI